MGRSVSQFTKWVENTENCMRFGYRAQSGTRHDQEFALIDKLYNKLTQESQLKQNSEQSLNMRIGKTAGTAIFYGWF